MYLKLLFCIFLVIFPVAMVVGQEEGANGSGAPGDKLAAAISDSAGEPDAKLVGGMSILGNKEAPMSLFIVPWKSSELGAETNLTRTLNERQVPVDREVFAREMAFYQASAGSTGSSLGAVSKVLNPR